MSPGIDVDGWVPFVYFEGDLRPGSSPGSITFSPMVVFANSNTILVELGGTTAGTLHDQLTFTSATTPQVSWGGELSVQFINAYTPAAGDSFDILN